MYHLHLQVHLSKLIIRLCTSLLSLFGAILYVVYFLCITPFVSGAKSINSKFASTEKAFLDLHAECLLFLNIRKQIILHQAKDSKRCNMTQKHTSFGQKLVNVYSETLQKYFNLLFGGYPKTPSSASTHQAAYSGYIFWLVPRRFARCCTK